jgi:hypothetical protein
MSGQCEQWVHSVSDIEPRESNPRPLTSAEQTFIFLVLPITKGPGEVTANSV